MDRRSGGADGEPPSGQATAARLLRIARRNRRLLLICLIVLPLAAFAASRLQEKQYTATANLLFRESQADQELFGNSSLTTSGDPQRAAATNLKLVSLEVVAQRTARRVGRGLTASDIQQRVKPTSEGESDLVSVNATDPDPRFAAVLANTFAEQFIAFRRDADRAKIRGAQAVAARRLAQLTPTERDSTEGRALAQREQELAVLAALQTGNAELAQRAVVPDTPSSPKTKRNVALGIVLGLLLGLGLVALREQLDRRLKEEEDVLDIFDLPVLARVPDSRSIRRRARSGHARDRSGAEAESFAILRANLRYFNAAELHSILVTSGASRDGKTTVSWNLALAEARAGSRVLYIEADLRRPTLADALGEQSAGGLSLVLAGMASLRTEIMPVDGIDVLFAGPTPPNPAALLESPAMTELLREGEARYDRVIIDTPPIGVVADAIPLMSRVNGVVIVTRLRQTTRDAAMRLRDQLTNTVAPVLGVVLNGVASTRGHYSYYSEPVQDAPELDPRVETVTNGSAPSPPPLRGARPAGRA